MSAAAAVACWPAVPSWVFCVSPHVAADDPTWLMLELGKSFWISPLTAKVVVRRCTSAGLHRYSYRQRLYMLKASEEVNAYSKALSTAVALGPCTP